MMITRTRALFQNNSVLVRNGVLTFLIRSQADVQLLRDILIPNGGPVVWEPDWQYASVILSVGINEEPPINNIMNICQALMQSGGMVMNRFPGFGTEQLSKFNDQNWLTVVNSVNAGAYEITCEYVRSAFIFTIGFRNMTGLLKGVMRITMNQNSPYVGP